MIPFPGIVGHERPIARLAQAAVRGVPHHAYIFHGHDGIGRRMVALAFAKALNCEQRPGDGAAYCDQCRSCRRIAGGTDADVWTVAPTAQTVGGPRSLRVGDVRELQTRLAYRLPEGRYRVVVLDDTERMTINAANSLLKTLEEPPVHTVLVLVTRRPGQLLPTVRSRCLQVGFGRLPVEVVARVLQERDGIAADVAARLAAASGGSIGRARALTPEDVDDQLSLLARFVDALEGGARERLALAGELAKRHTEARKLGADWLGEFIGVLQEVVRDAIHRDSGAASAPRRDDCAALAKRLASGYDAGILLRGLGAIDRARDRLERNMNAQLVLEALLLEFE